MCQPLTTKQNQVYEFIREQIHSRGYGPTVREIGQRFRIRSPMGVVCHLKALEKKGWILREPNKSRAIQLTTEPAQLHGLPLAGRIAAGVLHEAVETKERMDFSELFAKKAKERVVLKVQGDSMIEDQIADGDYVIVERSSRARKGQIVVALTDKNEATLKRWFPEKGRIRLQPANRKMRPIYVKQAKILGVLVGVVRRVG